MKRLALFLALGVSALGAQPFYSAPQSFLGIYSFRFIHTAFLFEDDLDKLFYPVKLAEIEGGRLFTALSNPFGNERLFDPTAPTNNQLVLGAKTNFFYNLSPLYIQTDFNSTLTQKKDTTYYENWSGTDNNYRDRIELRDSVLLGNLYGQKGFLLSLGNQSFGFLFLYANESRKAYPNRGPGFPFYYGNYVYSHAEYNNLNNNLTRKDTAISNYVADTTFSPLIGAISFSFGKFSGMVFGGFHTLGNRDTAGFFAESNTNPSAPFTGTRWNGSKVINAKAGGPIFGLQADFGFGGENWKSNLTLAYIFRSLSNGSGKSNEFRWQGNYSATTNPIFQRFDTTQSEYKYSSNNHDIVLFLRNKYPIHEQIWFGAGLGTEFIFGSENRDYLKVLNKNITHVDNNGNGSLDPGDFRTTNYTLSSYKQNISSSSFNYYIPVGFEVIPVSAWENFKLRFGAMYSHISNTSKNRTYNWSVESKTITETSGGTTETHNDIAVPGENISTTKSSFSNTRLYYGASLTLAERLVIDFTGFGNGILVPAFWRLSIVLKF
jgi:hypothetical protein